MKTRAIAIALASIAVALIATIELVPSLRADSVHASPPASPEQGSEWKRWQLTGSQLQDVDAVSTSDAWAVGGDGTLAHYNGTDWQVVAPAGVLTTTMYGVDMVSSSLGWALTSFILKRSEEQKTNSGMHNSISRWSHILLS